ncbi:PREDICTED: phosphatidylinositol 4-kinase gamma 8-like [Camelina sativa]|uniref:1-phosphatidylinositol 4-kinase n=1 Tax=Camelina sativa TaxID=90675 RepID=A0ABM0YQV2_CAMSA|nr:PREDICTED: phosphatidylinositol 4-kinase gamma 8-like [Camelina sativa]
MNCMAVALGPLTERYPQFSRSSQRCRLQSLTNLDFNFLDFNTEQTSTHSHSLDHRSISTPCFSISSNNLDGSSAAPRVEILGGQRVPTIRALVAEVTIAMVSGAQPLLLPSGLGGAYLLQTENGRSIAVAKPVDEEPLAFNNPKGGSGGLMLGQLGVKRSIRVGETGIRELAAYLLDHQGFSGVPPTALVRISHVPFHVSDSDQAANKVASLQRFVGHDFDAGELGSGSFTVASVHRIGILDVRVLNLDRHAGNMLVKKLQDQDESTCCNRVGAAELVPIHHGLCLPERLEDPYFEWLNWPQASVPFTDTELQYISNLDPFKDAELLRTELVGSMQESSLRVIIVCTIFLKQAAAAGLCLAEIGEKMTRDICRGEESSSVLEILCNKAKESVSCGTDDDDDYTSECNEVEAELECGIFQFDDEFECKELPDMLHVPLFTRVPSIAANLSALMRCPPNQWITTYDKVLANIANDTNREEDRRDRSILRSKSHPVCVNHDEKEGVYFGDMSADEWEMFLHSFRMLLPEALEGSTSKGPKPRLGSSCKF